MRRDPAPLVIRRGEHALVDRASLARLTGRSARTIRARCPVAAYSPDGRALYNAATCEHILEKVPTRQRRHAQTAQIC